MVIITIIVINTGLMVMVIIVLLMIITNAGRGQVCGVSAPCTDGDVQHHGKRCRAGVYGDDHRWLVTRDNLGLVIGCWSLMMMTMKMMMRLKYLVMIMRLIMMMVNETSCLQISQLMQFAEALLEYHKQCSEILQVWNSGKITLIFDHFQSCKMMHLHCRAWRRHCIRRPTSPLAGRGESSFPRLLRCVFFMRKISLGRRNNKDVWGRAYDKSGKVN